MSSHAWNRNPRLPDAVAALRCSSPLPLEAAQSPPSAPCMAQAPLSDGQQGRATDTPVVYQGQYIRSASGDSCVWNRDGQRCPKPPSSGSQSVLLFTRRCPRDSPRVICRRPVAGGQLNCPWVSVHSITLQDPQRLEPHHLCHRLP